MRRWIGEWFIAVTLITQLTLCATTFATAKKPPVTMEQARAKALALHPGEIKSLELEKEHGRLVYSFDIKTPDGIHEVNVDSETGKIVEDSIESPSREAKEAAKPTKAK